MLKIKELRQRHSITQSTLSDAIGVARSTIAMYESGASEPDFTTLVNLADFFRVSVDYLMGREDEKDKSQTLKIKVYGTIPAGIPAEMMDEWVLDGYEEVDGSLLSPSKEYFGLKVKGDSMYPEFRDGDTLIMQKQENCESGDYCAVSIGNSDSTFKKVLKQSGGVTLQPLNTSFQPIFYSNEEIMSLPVRILGVVKEVRRRY